MVGCSFGRFACQWLDFYNRCFTVKRLDPPEPLHMNDCFHQLSLSLEWRKWAIRFMDGHVQPKKIRVACRSDHSYHIPHSTSPLERTRIATAWLKRVQRSNKYSQADGMYARLAGISSLSLCFDFQCEKGSSRIAISKQKVQSFRVPPSTIRQLTC